MTDILLRTIPELEKYAAQWSELTPSSPFATWHFVHQWFRQHRASADPFVMAFTDSRGCLEAIVPWALVRGKFGSRVLTGVGEDGDAYHDPFAVSTDAYDRICGQVIGLLSREGRSWDLLSVKLRRDTSGRLIRDLSRLGWTFEAELPFAQNPIVDLSEGWEVYWQPRASRRVWQP